MAGTSKKAPSATVPIVIDVRILLCVQSSMLLINIGYLTPLTV